MDSEAYRDERSWHALERAWVVDLPIQWFPPVHLRRHEYLHKDHGYNQHHITNVEIGPRNAQQRVNKNTIAEKSDTIPVTEGPSSSDRIIGLYNDTSSRAEVKKYLGSGTSSIWETGGSEP